MEPDEIERTILARPLPAPLPAGEGWVMPHYDGLSIGNVPATIAALLTGEEPDAVLPGSLPALPGALWSGWKDGVQRVILVILDALGYRLLQRMEEAGGAEAFTRLAERGSLVPLTSVFPSTTDAALVTFNTGRPPAEHGWLAYEMYLRELGITANAIQLRPVWGGRPDSLVEWGMDPETLVGVPTLAQRLGRWGIETHALYSAYFRDSGFSKMLYRGVKAVRTHLLASDFWTELRALLADTRGKRAFLTAYWSGLDTVGHAYAPDTDAWRAELRTMAFLLDRELLEALPAADREGTLLLITADHGQIRVPPKHIVTANREPGLSRHLMVPIVGESRAAFVYPRSGQAEAVRSYLEAAYPGWFVVADSRAVLDAGLMGRPVSDESYARAGRLLVLPRGDHALQRAVPKVSLLGRHGGLTQDEMLVPLFGIRLDA
ncbi:MAG: alkaline phosphatase family protein [Anaerolineae bacterium]|nr:alkaline phosphatase family protein [Anaerolineae bacterium]